MSRKMPGVLNALAGMRFTIIVIKLNKGDYIGESFFGHKKYLLVYLHSDTEAHAHKSRKNKTVYIGNSGAAL